MKGELITPEGNVLKGELVVEGGSVKFEECECKPEFFFAPTFFNAHTHLGDSIAKDPPFMGLIELVGPGGYKHRVLEKAGEAVVDGIRNSLTIALESGTTALLDFREGGKKGLELLLKADKRGICLPLARPSDLREAEELIERSAGFGMSSTRDHDYEFLEELRDIAKRSNKLFGIHAGELDDGDVEDAIALSPDFIVHMNMASGRQLREVMDEGIPIISCIRSNSFFGLLNPKNYRILSEYGSWLLGTDNAMISKPSMLEEMHFASLIVKNDLAILKASVRGFELFGGIMGVIVFHRRRNFKRCRNPISTLVRRADVEDVERVILADLTFL